MIKEIQVYLIIIALVLIPIIIEDFKKRRIGLIWLLALVSFSLLYQSGTKIKMSLFISNSCINLGVIIFHYIFLTLYFSVRNKRWINLLKEHLGLGDVLFLVAVALFFSPMNFMFFLLASLLFSLIIFVPISYIHQKKLTVPLAGLQASFLLIIFLLSLFFDYPLAHDSFNDDALITALLSGLNTYGII